tara:strand:+ start:7067 stop:8251 length:1185 start_codon:yes stop_codon:yes gene_type:complete
MNIPIAKTYLKEDEINSVLEPLKSGWLVQGPKVKEFENEWCKFTGAKHSIAVTSCTSALHLSLIALGFKPGDEAIVPAFTWISTANVVQQLQGKVIFADIELNSFNIDIEKLESYITPKTKVILPVHLFGLSADIERIKAIARKYNLAIVEDAACGFGATFNGQHVGTFGDTGCFSFHPRKAITTGEGGMVTTNDTILADKIKCLRDHGSSISDLQRHQGPKPYLLADHIEAGYNQRMTDIQGALGLAQMNRAASIIKERRALAFIYNESFQEIDWLRTPQIKEGYSHGFQSYACLFRSDEVEKAISNNDFKTLEVIHKDRNTWMEFLQNKGISTRPSTHAVHMLTFYRENYKIKPKDFPYSFAANNCSISLPLFNGMTKEEQQYVIDIVKQGY